MTIVDFNKVAGSAVLAVLNMGKPAANAKHKGETMAVNEKHHVRDIAKVMVTLLDGNSYKAVSNYQATIRADHKRLTLPSTEENMRLLPAGRELEHSQLMTKHATEHARLVEQFMSEYDDVKEKRRIEMNGLYDPSKWPDRNVMAAKFYVRTQYLPMPTNGQWLEWLEKSLAPAEAELQDRLRKALEKVSERCKSDGKLHASVFDNLRELVALVPDLDFAGSFAPAIDAIQPLTAMHAEFLRDNEHARDVVARTADSILSGFLGGIK